MNSNSCQSRKGRDAELRDQKPENNRALEQGSCSKSVIISLSSFIDTQINIFKLFHRFEVKLLSHGVRLFARAPLSMGFSGQEYWSGLPCPSPGDLPNPGIEPGSPAL